MTNEGFMICVGRADEKSDRQELVTVTGRQYVVFVVHGEVGVDMENPDGKWVFDFDAESDAILRASRLRTEPSLQDELRQRLIDMGVYRSKSVPNTSVGALEESPMLNARANSLRTILVNAGVAVRTAAK